MFMPHYLPPVYFDALREAGITELDGGIPVPHWRIEDSLVMMDRQGITTQILSVSSPSVQCATAEKAARLAGVVNEAGAEYVHAHPGHFGLFATLPLDDIGASLAEINVAFDRLGADGIVMMTNERGIYLGDRRFDPVFDELSRRGAIVFLHPTSPACFEALGIGLPAPVIKFPFDTTRAALNLVFSGTTKRCPNIKFILPHAGGTLPYLVQRIVGRARLSASAIEMADALVEMRRFYCDTAGSANAHAIPALRQFVPVTQILFGGDFPFSPEPSVARFIDFFRSSDLFTDEERGAFAYGNAHRLFPRFATT
jgi:6-methylsalicylate decarboxylase